MADVYPASHAGLGPVQRLLVGALGRALPPHFRERQRAEWAADLLLLAGEPRLSRWRYLLGAAWTLPALRTVARDPSATGLTGGVVRPAGAAITTVARVLIVILVWALAGWLVVIIGPYLILDIPGRMATEPGFYMGPEEVWPDWPMFVLMIPLVLGGWLSISSAPVGPFFGVAILAVAVFERRRSWLHRMVVAGVAVVVGVLPISLSILAGRTGWIGWGLLPFNGLGIALLGLVGVITALAGRSLPRRTRVVLGVLSAAALVTFAVHQTPFGTAMITWFMD
ncbi:MAG: hypothetical protein ACRDT4_20030 [Micromonosporaceae bacterium]